MSFSQHKLTIDTEGRGMQEITTKLQDVIVEVGLKDGLLNLFLQHTSASLTITENADPTVRQDLERYFSSIIVDGDTLFKHDAEGADDMPAHIRNVLTQTSVNIPICNGRLALGTWQGVYLWEHRYRPHRRHIVVSVVGS